MMPTATKKTIKIIPATKPCAGQNNLVDPSKKLRVAAYARVSTDEEEQESSYR